VPLVRLGTRDQYLLASRAYKKAVEEEHGPVWDYFYGGGPVEYRIVLENWRKDKLDKGDRQ
jgi:hypothetical protein